MLRKLGHAEVFADNIVEVVVSRPFDCRVVIGAEVRDALRPGNRLVAARHVIRHDIDDDFHAGIMGALDQRLELAKAVGGIDSQVRIDVVKSANLPTPFSSMVPQGLFVVFSLPNRRVNAW